MKKIFTSQEIKQLGEELHQQKKSVVVAGGCFDILHPGHILFLEAAKKRGDRLVLLLESDETIRRLKRDNRPLQPQKDRACVLAALESVDAIIMLQPDLVDSEYDELILALKPAIIATTEGDQYLHHKKRQAELVDGRVISVISRMAEYSTSSLIKKLQTYE